MMPTKVQAIYPEAIAGERMRQLEVKYDLLKYEVDGWSVWPLLRFPLAMALTNLPMVSMNRVGLVQLLPIVGQDIFRLLSLRQSRYLVTVYASNRLEQEDKLYKDIFFDELLQNIGSYFKIEHVDNKIFIAHRKSALIKSNLTSTTFKSVVRLLAKASGPCYISGIAQQLSTWIESKLELNTFSPSRLTQLFRRFYWSKKVYGWFIGQIQPKYLFLVTAYADYALVAAAKEQGVQVIEFQHGSLDRYHIGYSWPAQALPYKAKMPLPDRIFLYGRYWQEELEATGFWSKELCSVGSLRIDQYRRRKAPREDNLYTIVLTTQGVDTERLITFMADFLKLAQGQLAFRLYIKLHPAERSKEVYEVVFSADERVRILLSSEAPSTFELLSQAHLHLSIYSTCHYEALGLGVPTVILPLTSYEMVLHLKEAGQAFLASTPQALLDIVLQTKHYQVPAEVGAYYFETNALANMKKEMGL